MGATSLAQTVSYDDRPVLHRARRRQLLDVCKARKIQLPSENIPKDDILKVMEANGINLNAPVPELDWREVHGKDENGQPHVELYPVIPEHQSASQVIDYDAEIRKRAEAAEQQVEEKANTIEALMKRLEALEANSIPIERATPAQLKKIAKDKGLDIAGLSTKEDLLKLIRG